MALCQNDGKLPSFSWLNKESPFGVPLLKIGFPDGGLDEIVFLRKFNPIPVGPNERADSVDECIYNGFLSKEKSHVTLTGCAKSNNFQVFLKMFRTLGNYNKNIYQIPKDVI